MKNLILPIFLLVWLWGCAPNPSNPLNAGFHDLTAHYNAYFIADEHISAIENTLHANQQWNYNRILPIYPPVDSTIAAGFKEQLEDCVQKASISIQFHPGSKWEYPAYILVGKARLYGLEFPDAVETFKYVNTKSKDKHVRHEALVNLMRVFAANYEFNNAVAVADFLKNDLDEMNTRNQQLYYFNQAYLYQLRGDLDLMVQNLVKAEELQSNSRDRARIQFIIGQVYQQLGFDASAYYYYEKSLRSSPSYELSFFTKLNMAQVTQKSEDRDVKTVRKYFKKLLVDRKNLEYHDKIYFEMGVFEQKNGNLEEAIVNYKKSVRASTNNNRQKGLSYLSLARIHYDSLRNYEMAKTYYDSTVTVLPQDEENYSAIKQRQEILTEFVKHIVVVRKNDSLLALSRLPADSLRALALSVVTRDSLNEAEAKARKERLARVQAQREKNFASNDGALINTSATGTWYFYNQTSVSKGYTAFQRKWKDRPLEDNWRRSVKVDNSTVAVTPSQPAAVQEAAETAPEATTASVNEKVEEMLKAVPASAEERQVLLDQVRDALYALGNIFNFKLNEKPFAIETFDQLLARFPKSEYEPEVLYQLYLLKQEPLPEGSRLAANRLLHEYPNTVYAKLIQNPNYREESFAETMQLQKVYKSAYELYRQQAFEQSLAKLDSVLRLYPENEFSDNVDLLRILNIGQLEGQYKYQFELDNFVKQYSESELLPYVQGLIKSSDEFKANLYSSSKAKYIPYFDQAHYFVLFYTNPSQNGETASKLVRTFLEKNYPQMKFGNLMLSDEYAMLVVNDLANKEAALRMHSEFVAQMRPAEELKGQKHFVVVISEDNFDILYTTKDLESYRTFFDRYYQ